VGYRASSVIGTAFRIWATKVLKQHFLEGIQDRQRCSIAIDTSAAKDGDTLNRSGYVYLIRSSTGFYKIGWTKDPHSRRRTFDVKLPFETTSCTSSHATTPLLPSMLFTVDLPPSEQEAGGYSLTDDDVAYIQSRFRG
jgi:hypothetical protein